MKIPQKPPNLLAIEKRVLSSPELFNKVLDEAKKFELKQKYIHWNEFRRHKPIPEGLTHEELWFGIKLHRSAGMKQVPLSDKKGDLFCYTIPDFLTRLLHTIDLAVGKIGIPTQIMDKDSSPSRRYHERSLTLEAIASSQLEGAATTQVVAKQMIRLNRPPRDNSERMILNNYHAMQQTQQYKDHSLDLELMLRIHRSIADDTFEYPDAVGRFRDENELIDVKSPENEIVHEPPPACELPERFQAMCDFANGKTPHYFIHPVIRSIILHFWLAYDHPFMDGNGRCARALFYWSMLRHGYWLFEYISISKILLQAPIQYGMAYLHSETDANDLTYFIVHQVQVIQKALKEFEAYVDKKEKEREEIAALLQAGILFNYRQQVLLADAIHHSGKHYTVEEHKAAHQIVYETARKDLNELYKYGLLKRIKRGKAFIYISPPDLAQIIRSFSDKCS